MTDKPEKPLSERVHDFDDKGLRVEIAALEDGLRDAIEAIEDVPLNPVWPTKDLADLLAKLRGLI